ncbi:MAG TPA: zinc dependent phospholipase C family protein, partial [Dehalococcoidia bacterium]
MLTAFVAIVAMVLLWPEHAHAWGPVTHLIHGSHVLDSLSTAPAVLQEILAAHRVAYLYGCIAPDIMHAKRYTRTVYTHCHCWRVGWQVVAAARTDRERAFAHGYLSHLVGDVHSHNHFVPVRLVTTYDALGMGHVYWEARFDAAQHGAPWQLVRHVLSRPTADLDDLVERTVERTLFSFRTNKRIFSSLLLVQQLDRWQQLVREVGRRSRHRIDDEEVERFNGQCVDAIRDLLHHGVDSASQAADPTGAAALQKATRLRRRLRTLRRQGTLPAHISREIAAL